MYLWIGCKLPEEFAQRLRQQCLKRNETIGLDTVAFTLPQHISLKISFPAEHWTEIIDWLEQHLGRQQPFTVQLLPPQRRDSILWLPVVENAELQQLHRELDIHLEDRFGIQQHQFDKCFQFHSTLFMDADDGKLEQMLNALRPLPIACNLTVDTFLLGVSETGAPGSYRVLREISL